MFDGSHVFLKNAVRAFKKPTIYNIKSEINAVDPVKNGATIPHSGD
jgi:hypothetical protein